MMRQGHTATFFDNGAKVTSSSSTAPGGDTTDELFARFMSAVGAHPSRGPPLPGGGSDDDIILLERRILRDANEASGRITAIEENGADKEPGGMQIGAFLGDGSYGATFKCRVKLRDGSVHDTVIKLPVQRLNLRKIIRRRRFAEAEEDLDEFLSEYGTRRRYDAAKAVSNFEQEHRNAQALLEPDCALRREARNQYRLPPLSSHEYLEILRDRRELRARPGYHHLHKILHFAVLFSETVPALFSEEAEGTLNRFVGGKSLGDMIVVNNNSRPSKVWMQAAQQLLLAQEYIEDRGLLRHVDIKPSNILYRTVGKGRIHCMLGDFGVCLGKEHRAFSRSEGLFRGTAVFNPPLYQAEDDDDDDTNMKNSWKDANCADLACFQCVTTLLSLLTFRFYSSERHGAFDYVHALMRPAEEFDDPRDDNVVLEMGRLISRGGHLRGVFNTLRRQAAAGERGASYMIIHQLLLFCERAERRSPDKIRAFLFETVRPLLVF